MESELFLSCGLQRGPEEWEVYEIENMGPELQ